MRFRGLGRHSTLTKTSGTSFELKLSGENSQVPQDSPKMTAMAWAEQQLRELDGNPDQLRRGAPALVAALLEIAEDSGRRPCLKCLEEMQALLTWCANPNDTRPRPPLNAHRHES